MRGSSFFWISAFLNVSHLGEVAGSKQVELVFVGRRLCPGQIDNGEEVVSSCIRDIGVLVERDVSRCWWCGVRGLVRLGEQHGVDPDYFGSSGRQHTAETI